ncbi:L-ascorbate metabolism protein UlaG (beta-lactamase superfamily) [Isoptericola jiangsuensis]|uniref:L-ascorbate metabolism protein UlaG (Beta-lactamase superfamily) n=1 Tax=Isoptericola jiangsuensis TaxID=548579 RepID=A0A2A9EUL5_9MICO|nr:MBL fold metallo-hydrolase [Isoptericola jiangsuensis]PFG41925.1 L-ascorbate metabolism protein UlaG (beta-lactamase superfamily) [Isoptericola jiangsuensis]
MTGIELTTWGHAGLRLERDGVRVVLDPGSFTDPAVLDGATAVLVTHGHPDHVVPERLAAVLDARPALTVRAPASVVDALRTAGAPPDRVHEVSPGDVLSVAGLPVRVLGGEHAEVHPQVPVPENVGYLVAGVLHPGDAWTPVPDDATVDVLALPVAGPWVRLGDAVDYAVRVAPRVAVPVHDAVLSDLGKGSVDRIAGGLVDRLLGRETYRRLEPGEALAVTG